MLSYHELTLNEDRNSPARQKQFQVICVIGVAILSHALMNSGIFQPVVIEQGVFPGGEFVYKEMERDYAASGGVISEIANDLLLTEEQHDNLLFTVFLDDFESYAPGGHSRFLSGILIDQNKEDLKKALLQKNDSIPDVFKDKSMKRNSRNRKYQVGTLPSVDAAVVQFPFTNGFVSALIHQYKVFPSMVKYVQEHHEQGNTIVISSTCSIKNKICTHYSPLLEGKQFFLGRQDTATYVQSLDLSTSIFDPEYLVKQLKKVLSFGKAKV